MNEPTAALNRAEITRLHAIVRRLAAQGKTIMYVSHHLDEVSDLCDEVAVLRDGSLVHRSSTSELDEQTLIEHMLGRKPQVFGRADGAATANDARLVVDGLSIGGFEEPFSLAVGTGEIVAGLAGSGRGELTRALVGDRAVLAGSISIDGGTVQVRSVCTAIRAGIYMLSEDRKIDRFVGSSQSGVYLGSKSASCKEREDYVVRQVSEAQGYVAEVLSPSVDGLGRAVRGSRSVEEGEDVCSALLQGPTETPDLRQDLGDLVTCRVGHGLYHGFSGLLVGVSVGSYDALVDPLGRLSLLLEQRNRSVALLVGEEITTGVQGPAGGIDRIYHARDGHECVVGPVAGSGLMRRRRGARRGGNPSPEQPLGVARARQFYNR